MKLFLLALSFLALASPAYAFQFPSVDFGLMQVGQKKAVAMDVSVKNYAASLSATKFKVTAKSTMKDPIIYTVSTNSGCTFDVQVVYEANFFDGVRDVIVLTDSKVCQ